VIVLKFINLNNKTLQSKDVDNLLSECEYIIVKQKALNAIRNCRIGTIVNFKNTDEIMWLRLFMVMEIKRQGNIRPSRLI
jgi:hypothetical protein